jgi:hypothetical protein
MGGGREAYDKAVTDKQRNRVRINDMLKQLKQIPKYKKLDEKGLMGTPEAKTLLGRMKDSQVGPQQRTQSDFEDDF